jgi:hypothetical protein
MEAIDRLYKELDKAYRKISAAEDIIHQISMDGDALH